jgi:peroxiredoxin
MAIQIGEKAPHFKLKNQHSKEVSLEDFAGKNVVLSFHPLAFTRVCTYQMQDLEKSKGEFDKTKRIALGIKCRPRSSKTRLG